MLIGFREEDIDICLLVVGLKYWCKVFFVLIFVKFDLKFLKDFIKFYMLLELFIGIKML